MRQGFTLVELSVVLVIIGLLVGGILTGRNLINAGQIRAAINESNMYRSALSAFREKYRAIPGDMPDATTYWGDNPAAGGCADAAIADGSPGTCNGDGDAGLTYPSAASSTGEMFQIWNQLALAGMIGGTYTGFAGSGSTAHTIVGTNAPASRMKGSGWGFGYAPNSAGSADAYALDYGIYLNLGAGSTSSTTLNPTMTPKQAWGIDHKIDDGLPARGMVIARWRSTCADSTAVNDYDSDYRINVTTIECSLIFRSLFSANVY